MAQKKQVIKNTQNINRTHLLIISNIGEVRFLHRAQWILKAIRSIVTACSPVNIVAIIFLIHFLFQLDTPFKHCQNFTRLWIYSH